MSIQPDQQPNETKMKRPDKLILKKYNVYVEKDTVFRAKARLLQSIWRSASYNFLDESNILGNYLPLELSRNKPLNFFNNEDICQIVKKEIEDSKITGAVISQPRIWNNLLSSQPLCFNLFGELKLKPDLAKKLLAKVLQKQLSNELDEIVEIRFEYSPGRGDEKYLGDGTAFDVFIVYKTKDSQKGFIGIEVKYSEDMKNESSAKSKSREERERYIKAAVNSKIFKLNDDAKKTLLDSNIHQIWRDHLLALRMLEKDKCIYEEGGYFAFVYPKDNIQCEKAIEKYLSFLISSEPNLAHFLPITLEEIISCIDGMCCDDWVKKFWDRYLEFGKIDTL